MAASLVADHGKSWSEALQTAQTCLRAVQLPVGGGPHNQEDDEEDGPIMIDTFGPDRDM
jgi:hypothetical protein